MSNPKTQGEGLGRIQHFDPRNYSYRIRQVVPVDTTIADALKAEPARRRRYWFANGHWEDQGQTPECTAAALLHWREDGPITVKGPTPAGERVRLYKRIQLEDRTAGRYYPAGATSLAMARVAVAEGMAGEYRWGYTVDEIVAALLALGPVAFGSNWTTGMDRPDAQGFVQYTGSPRGGHEYVLNGVNLDREFVRLKNSWGRGWGTNGHAKMSFATLAHLLADNGDATIFRELP